MIPPLTVEAICIVGVIIQAVLGDSDKCEYRYTYRKGASGTFSSPKFPEQYPELVTCYYYFDASSDGRIQIQFEFFDLEDKARDHSSCRFDYIDVFSVDRMGYKTLLSRFCGSKKPEPITSIQSKMEMIFVSDYTKTATGFLGHYKFLDDSWQPFGPPSSGCGSEAVGGTGGVITSPFYPSPFPGDVKCTWLIKVKEGHSILINIISMDMGASAQCSNQKLLIYNGFATPDMKPEKKFCGQLHSYQSSEKEFLSSSSRVVIRFLSGNANTQESSGFQLSWSAVLVPEDGHCDQFMCSGGHYCVDGALCSPLQRYCIDSSLRCNGIPNCGAFDDSDERKCPREILIMTACIAIPSLGVIMLIIIVVYCYRKKRVKKSLSQEQPLANQRQVSRDSMSPSRSQCTMHTSFIDGKPPGEEGHSERPSDRMDNGAMPPEPNFKTHQKRASYHMMKQTCFEDGNFIIAEI